MARESTIAQLRESTAAYMRKLEYSESRIVAAKTAWNQLERYMEEFGAEEFTPDVADGFNEYVLAGRQYEELPRWDRDKIVLVGALVEMQALGRIKYRRDSKFIALTGPIANEASALVSDLRRKGVGRSTLENYKAALNRFSQYLDACGHASLEQVTPAIIIAFMEGFAFSGPHSRKCAATTLRALFKKAYGDGRLDEDLSRHVPKIKKVKQPSLPSVYAQEEIDSILACVDRASDKGKRDYAMLLLAARLGLRASDICGLTFSSLEWRSSTLHILQFKTNEPLELPILPEVGEAIIDYIRYSRPSSDLPYVFLSVAPPFDRLSSQTLASIVTQYVNAAGVNRESPRRHGAHALRHSLAANLLKAQTPLPVISSVLGHTSSESTRYYLRIDESSLRKCALEVPEVAR